MADLPLTMACGPYDRMEALRYGQVRPDGVDLRYLSIQNPTQIFGRMLQHREFDVAEMSCSGYLCSRGQDDYPFVALPVFPSKVFRHGFIFINTQAGIQDPKDLEGKKIGVPAYRQTAAVWIRGILKEEYGVALDRINWYEGPIDEPEVHPLAADQPNKQVSLQVIPPGKSLSGMLESGELDALISARSPACMGKSDRVRRLFPNYRELEREYYGKTGIFPIMHTVVVQEELYRENPWLAQSMYKAMEESKNRCLSQMRYSGAMRYVLPWLYDDLDEMDRVFGGDPWPYGLEANRVNLETLQRYLVDQGLAKEARPLEELFTPVIETGN